MKIKCVSNVNSMGLRSVYLTVNKIYDIDFCDDNDDFGTIVDDEGDILFEFLPNPGHGAFEVVK